VLPEAGTNRVYDAVSTLRVAGLRQVVEKGRDGYRLAPDLEVVISDALSSARHSDPTGWLS
jgi:hypothetical protein